MAAISKHRGLFCWILLVAYLIVLFYFLFFAESMGRNGEAAEYRYNLILFREIRRFIRYRAILGWKAVTLNLLGNIIAFMPFGYLVSLLMQVRPKWYVVLLLSFELSLGVELLQLGTKMGSFDVDDMLLNSLGGVLGYITYRLFVRMHIHREYYKEG